MDGIKWKCVQRWNEVAVPQRRTWGWKWLHAMMEAGYERNAACWKLGVTNKWPVQRMGGKNGTKATRQKESKGEQERGMIWQRKEVHRISRDLTAASCPRHRYSCLLLNEAPSVTGSLLPTTSPFILLLLRNVEEQRETIRGGGGCHIDFKMSEDGLTVSELWHIVQYEPWSAFQCLHSTVFFLLFFVFCFLICTGPNTLWMFWIVFYSSWCHWFGVSHLKKKKKNPKFTQENLAHLFLTASDL